ncbi:hypothetical protein GF359_09185 [candidate division WOR-3 bacterium]|uniref:LptE family protein n=1 Tax=candidate division WOR-3 bacterium TaxID=2052148 RepID=A0A9D5KAS3_UNCW3|nr:hypothetical protein [candidate division WOR-3 bacterium]MBD3365372.1 hypothetical protein [candidate division WOR-3 bacterium]
MQKILTRTLVLAFAYLGCVGCCGYSTRSLLPTYIKTIHVTDVENRTLRSLIGEDLFDQLIFSFSRDGRLRVSPDESADLLLEVTVTSYNRSAATYDNQRNISEWRYQLRLKGICTDQVKSNTLWEGEETVFEIVSADLDEEEGISTLIETAVDRIVRNVLLAW